MDTHYIWEKLYGAIDCLIGTSSMKIRLSAAYVTLAFLSEEDIPEIIKKDYMNVMQPVRIAKPVSKEGKIKAAVNRMTNTEASDMAKIILGMYSTITRQLN